MGIGQVLQGFGQPHTDYTGWGEGDREVPERFIGRAVGCDAPPGRGPLLAPPGFGQAGSGQVLAGVGESFAALDDMDPPGRPVPFGPSNLGTEVLDAALLLEAFGLSGVSLDGLRLSAGFALGDSQGVIGWGGQTRLDGGDHRTQPHNVAVLPITGQSDLIIVAGDDRVGPAPTTAPSILSFGRSHRFDGPAGGRLHPIPNRPAGSVTPRRGRNVATGPDAQRPGRAPDRPLAWCAPGC
ncbi:MAG: hypothetical protein JWR34_7000 [Mycobacterium sp.]|nr:hypothetical protein [Mycobacterium sp.]